MVSAQPALPRVQPVLEPSKLVCRAIVVHPPSTCPVPDVLLPVQTLHMLMEHLSRANHVKLHVLTVVHL